MRKKLFLVLLALSLLLTGCGAADVKDAQQTVVTATPTAPVFTLNPTPTTAPTPEPTPNHDTPDLSDLAYPFDQMSADWSDDTLDGWYHYEIPEEYARYSGYLPDIVQVYAYALCAQRGIDYYMLLAMIEVESGYQWDAKGASGELGYMQIIPKWHLERLGEGAESEALLNPYVNIKVGIDILAELSERYETKDEVLTAYNCGPTGAYKYYWSRGETGSPYSDEVLEAARRIKEEITGVSREDEAHASMNTLDGRD